MVNTCASLRSGLALVVLALLASPVTAQSGVGKPIIFNWFGFAGQIIVICSLTLVLMGLVIYHRDLKRRSMEKPADLTLRILHEDEELDATGGAGSHYSEGSNPADVGVVASNPSFMNMQRQATMEWGQK